MQEEIENRTVNLAISTTRLSAQALVQAWRAYQSLGRAERDMEARLREQTGNKSGKMTVKELVGKDQGVTSLDIGKTRIRDFDRIAQKYGIDYAITKDTNSSPPHYTVFFKSKEEDAMTAAFSEYTAQVLNKDKRPSIRKALQHFAALVAQVPEKIRNQQRER